MNSVVIKNVTIINEHARFEGDVRFRHQRIEKIASQIQPLENERVIDAQGKWLLPGMIDDQVHFREPGLTHKGSIATESRAAVMGGITSFMEMPNVNPSTTTLAAIEHKEAIARHDSFANYAFYLGATEDNLEVIKSLDSNRVCGVKVFMGASTGSLLVENPTILEAIFRESPVLIATHCESGPVIQRNLDRLLQKTQPHPFIITPSFATTKPAMLHPLMRLPWLKNTKPNLMFCTLRRPKSLACSVMRLFLKKRSQRKRVFITFGFRIKIMRAWAISLSATRPSKKQVTVMRCWLHYGLA
jgi:dihydroorotase-like cyclic amidohydrolase